MATMLTDSTHLSHLLQISDTAFPTGGYAHSLGFEEMARRGLVHDESTLRDFLCAHVIPLLETMDLPLAHEAHSAACANSLKGLLEIDLLSHVLKIPREIREASIQMGSRRLAMLVKIHNTPLLGKFQSAIASKQAHGHHPVVWGAATSFLPASTSLTSFLYQSLAGLCLAAPKLIRIGPEGVQRSLVASLGSASEIVARALEIPREDIGGFDPALDIASMRHETATERLFIS